MSKDLRGAKDVYNQLIRIFIAYAHGNVVCDSQSTNQATSSAT